ncbi:MAG: L-threonylcarbamoyladenylate synthase [bacterium]|nr:L-threonylcarbamoyladenylate synthase [bacterium]
METLEISPNKIEKEIVEKIVNLLRKGKVIIFPTDTVYIPMADATDKKAVGRVFRIKRRSLENPIPIFVKDMKMAKKIAKIGKKQENILRKAWPGRVTAVLERKKTKIKLYGVASDSVALRIPDFKPINLILEELNRPLVGTSANISGRPASGNLREVIGQLKGKRFQPDLTVDGGNLPGVPSTVIDLRVLPPKILRK